MPRQKASQARKLMIRQALYRELHLLHCLPHNVYLCVMDWKELFGRAASESVGGADHLIRRLQARLGHVDPIQILPYRTFGTAHRLYLKGRVLEDETIGGAKDKDTILNNLLNMYKSFESD